MSIREFADKKVTVARMSTVSGNKRALQTTATVDLHIQDLDAEQVQQLGIVQGKAWIAYFDELDFSIQEGDRITDNDGIDYKVKEINPKKYSFGINQHIEVILVEYSKE